MARFDYLLQKIVDAPYETDPFRHVYIQDFFSAADFAEIVGAPEIDVPAASSDDELFDILHAHGYRAVQFPGCITSRDDYIRWHARRKTSHKIHSACEGFGVTLRLAEARTPLIAELMQFLSSERFNRTLAEKFDLRLERSIVDNGIQKYLDGYEISPHPDIRAKAATFMVNINPHPNAETLEHHTHYLRFRPKYEGVQQKWEEAPNFDRCWVPWGWCDTVKTQPKNNSIVLFSPQNDTVHAVRARYDHLPAQRTQLYGNLWHADYPKLTTREWEDLGMDKGELTLAGAKRMAIRALRSAKRGLVSGKAGESV